MDVSEMMCVISFEENRDRWRFADRLLGSPQLYGHEQRDPEQSVNFVTSHDGFTLNDLVSYNQKHNQANGEENRDGTNDNHSWNCGTEGPTNDATIEQLRNRQAKNFLAVTLLSLGLPMFVMGDEVRRTQLGNNNAYCQDNEISWSDWSLLSKHADLYRFVKTLIARRRSRDSSAESLRIPLTELIKRGVKGWHGVKPNQPDWSNQSQSIALSLELLRESLEVYLIFNAYWEPLHFELPLTKLGEQYPWRRWIDTSLETPQDIVEWREAPSVAAPTYRVGPRSVVVLWAAVRQQ
jgi:glycogen operon protein